MRVGLPAALIFWVSQTFAQNWTQPPVGQFCPPGFTYDSANCHLALAPSGSQPGISGTSFAYTSSSGCISGFSPSGGECFRQVPAGYAPFMYSGSFYVKPNLHFVRQNDPSCPPGSTYDSANCFFGKAPAGTTARLFGMIFAFTKAQQSQSCNTIRPGSVSIGPWVCRIAPVPTGWVPFIFDNGWYVQPKQVFNGKWLARDYMPDGPPDQRPSCLGAAPPRNWQLLWSDEFSDQPDNQKCYTSNDQLSCILRPYWGTGACESAPVDWHAGAVATNWTSQQAAKFAGIRNLDKCRWSVYETFNVWEVWSTPRPPMAERTNSYRPENIRVGNGVLTVRTNEHSTAHPADGYCCGMQIEPDPPHNGEMFTNGCPYSGALLQTISGFGVPPGRIEFRARMTKLGHGGWMNLWLFTDQMTDPQGPAGELDAVEFIGDQVPAPNESVIVQGLPEQIKRQSSTYGMAWQTAHDWYPTDHVLFPNLHVSNGIGIPIGLGEWHTYAVEWETAEVRFLIDGCVTQRLVEGQQVTDRWSQETPKTTHTFHVPKDQTMSVIIGAPASAAQYLKPWYRAYLRRTDACGNSSADCPNADQFEASEMEVDYVRAYIDPDHHKAAPSQMVPAPRIQRPRSEHQPPT